MCHYDFNEFTKLCIDKIVSGIKTTYLFSNSLNIFHNIHELKHILPYNVFLFDCCEYYNDEEIFKNCNLIIKKKGNIMSDFMNMNTNTNINTYLNNIINNNPILFNNIEKLKKFNIIFLLNINTYDESCKNIITLLNNLSNIKTGNFHFFIVSIDNFNDFFKNTYDSIDKTDFINYNNYTLINEKLNITYFKNLKTLLKYKKYIFPINKIKFTKNNASMLVNNLLFFITKSNTNIELKSNDYKNIIIDYLTQINFDYSIFLTISHYENIPLILYENSKLILHSGYNNINTDDEKKFIDKIRQLCLDYYSFNNDPDISLFNNTNLYYFLYNYKYLLISLNIAPIVNKLQKIVFTKYYSNRAAEIQYQKNMDCDI
jgi:hypothetical protein